MKATCISNERHTALIFRLPAEPKKILVKWFFNETQQELIHWPNNCTPLLKLSAESLLTMVKQYAEKNGLTLWSY